jgi:hypothetical protein
MLEDDFVLCFVAESKITLKVYFENYKVENRSFALKLINSKQIRCIGVRPCVAVLSSAANVFVVCN